MSTHVRSSIEKSEGVKLIYCNIENGHLYAAFTRDTYVRV